MFSIIVDFLFAIRSFFQILHVYLHIVGIFRR